jgi:hypothetical protein
MAVFDLIPTIEMVGPGGKIRVNNREQDIAHHVRNGFRKVPGSERGVDLTVTESDVEDMRHLNPIDTGVLGADGQPAGEPVEDPELEEPTEPPVVEEEPAVEAEPEPVKKTKKRK